MVLDEAYELLKETGIVSSESEFSEWWLGHSECYLRTLRFKSAEPSIGSIAICASRLGKAGKQMLATNRYRHIGLRFIEISDKIHNLVNEQSVVLELSD
jgi:hypothetical protein